MTAPTIRAALEAAARELCDSVSHQSGVYDALPDGPARMGLLETKADWRLLAAGNNAAFLRALPNGPLHATGHFYARMVEAAAKEGRDG